MDDMGDAPAVRRWKERVAAGAERVKDWRTLDAIVVVVMLRGTFEDVMMTLNVVVLQP
jgi:hypothetical protein